MKKIIRFPSENRRGKGRFHRQRKKVPEWGFFETFQKYKEKQPLSFNGEKKEKEACGIGGKYLKIGNSQKIPNKMFTFIIAYIF